MQLATAQVNYEHIVRRMEKEWPWIETFEEEPFDRLFHKNEIRTVLVVNTCATAVSLAKDKLRDAVLKLNYRELCNTFKHDSVLVKCDYQPEGKNL